MSLVTAVDVPTPSGPVDSLLAVPDGAGPAPAVLMFMDAFGLRPRLADMAARLADLGHVVLVPNLFHRAGRAPLTDLSRLADPARRGEIFATVAPHIAALTPELALADITAYLAFLDADPRVADGSIAAVGYCMGGRLALRAAAAFPERVAAAASFHAGGLVTDAADSPHRVLAPIRGEVYVGHADHDRSNTPEQQAAVELALAAAGVRHTAELYVGCEHGFTMADTSAYSPDGEARHWEVLEDLLARTLRA